VLHSCYNRNAERTIQSMQDAMSVAVRYLQL